MAEDSFESDFFFQWPTLPQPKVSQKSKTSSRFTNETEEQREKRLKKSKERSALQRSCETKEQREKRLKDQRDRMALKRLSESPAEREDRLKKAREREYYRRQNETAEKREKRLQTSREKASLRRYLETPEKRESRLRSSRLRAAQRRHALKEASSIDSVDSNSNDLEPKCQTSTSKSDPNSVPKYQATEDELILDPNIQFSDLEDLDTLSNKLVIGQEAINNSYVSEKTAEKEDNSLVVTVASDTSVSHNSSSGLMSTANLTTPTAPTSVGVADNQAEPSESEASCSFPLASCQEEEEDVGGYHGGRMGLLERRYDHPDFNVKVRKVQRLQNNGCVHAVVLNST